MLRSPMQPVCRLVVTAFAAKLLASEPSARVRGVRRTRPARARTPSRASVGTPGYVRRDAPPATNLSEA
jgi:hypothetical protein